MTSLQGLRTKAIKDKKEGTKSSEHGEKDTAKEAAAKKEKKGTFNMLFIGV